MGKVENEIEAIRKRKIGSIHVTTLDIERTDRDRNREKEIDGKSRMREKKWTNVLSKFPPSGKKPLLLTDLPINNTKCTDTFRCLLILLYD